MLKHCLRNKPLTNHNLISFKVIKQKWNIILFHGNEKEILNIYAVSLSLVAIFFYLGNSIFLPWNCFIRHPDFFTRFCLGNSPFLTKQSNKHSDFLLIQDDPLLFMLIITGEDHFVFPTDSETPFCRLLISTNHYRMSITISMNGIIMPSRKNIKIILATMTLFLYHGT